MELPGLAGGGTSCYEASFTESKLLWKTLLLFDLRYFTAITVSPGDIGYYACCSQYIRQGTREHLFRETVYRIRSSNEKQRMTVKSVQMFDKWSAEHYVQWSWIISTSSLHHFVVYTSFTFSYETIAAIIDHNKRRSFHYGAFNTPVHYHQTVCDASRWSRN